MQRRSARSTGWQTRTVFTAARSCWCLRACLKIHSRHLHTPLRGIFDPDSVSVAYYASFTRPKSSTKCDAQLTKSNFQTHSDACLKIHIKHIKTGQKIIMRFAGNCCILSPWVHEECSSWENERWTIQIQ
ncbi:DUF6783 domain-containing protein [Enterocloster sp.]|uniref:DUF6783 domain-containing protein n=1 Tax=Enterocloster sp. TaxID=2719315 RepID=UPI00399318A4